MDKITHIVDSKFRFVLLASQRAEQIMRGARPKVENPKGKVTRIAIEEILDGAVDWDYGPAPDSAAEDDATVDAEEASEGDGVN